MTTKLKMLPVRVSPTLRALIDQGGPVNAATRALIILGAEAAGLDLAGMEREVAGLLTENLAPQVCEELRHILLQNHEVRVTPKEEGTQRIDSGEATLQETMPPAIASDPFNNIGVEV